MLILDRLFGMPFMICAEMLPVHCMHCFEGPLWAALLRCTLPISGAPSEFDSGDNMWHFITARPSQCVDNCLSGCVCFGVGSAPRCERLHLTPCIIVSCYLSSLCGRCSILMLIWISQSASFLGQSGPTLSPLLVGLASFFFIDSPFISESIASLIHLENSGKILVLSLWGGVTHAGFVFSEIPLSQLFSLCVPNSDVLLLDNTKFWVTS